MNRIETVGAARCAVGESPVWDEASGALYWVDVDAPRIYRHDFATDETEAFAVDGTYLGCMALRRESGAVLAMDDGFYFYDFERGEAQAVALPEANRPGTVFNDGKVDARGRFIAGSTDTAFSEPIGTLYRLTPDRRCQPLTDDIICVNGPCWSPDGATFYFADSVRQMIYACAYDLDTGQVLDRQPFLSTAAWDANPDGATVDSQGYVWSALFNGGRVLRIAPDGRVDREVELPVRFVSSVMFGGPGLDTLFVTSIGKPIMGLSDPSPDAGRVFAVHDLGVKGRPEPRFEG